MIGLWVYSFNLSLKNVKMNMIKRERINTVDDNQLYTTSLDNNEKILPTIKENSDNSEYSVNEEDEKFVHRLFNEASGGKFENKTLSDNHWFPAQLDDDETILDKLTLNDSKDLNQYTTSLDNEKLNISNNSINQDEQININNTNIIKGTDNIPEKRINITEEPLKVNLQNTANPTTKQERVGLVTISPIKEKLNEFPSIPSPPPVPMYNSSQIISPSPQPSSTVTNINIEIDNPEKENPNKEKAKNVLSNLIAELDKIISKQTEKNHSTSEINTNAQNLPIQYYPVYIPVYYPQPSSSLPTQFYPPLQNTVASLPQMPNQNFLNQPSPNYNQPINNNFQKQVIETQNSFEEIHTNNKKNSKKNTNLSNSFNIINHTIIDEPKSDNFLNSPAYVVYNIDNKSQSQPQIANNQNELLYNLV